MMKTFKKLGLPTGVLRKGVFVFIAIVLFLITVIGASALTPPTGGVSYYNFDDLDDQWGTNDATNNGATSSTDYPEFNISGDSSPNSFSFDGDNDYVDTGQRPDYINQFTWSAWIKKDVNHVGEIISVSSDTFSNELYVAEGELRFRITTTEKKNTLYHNININTWYHVLATYDNSNMKMYINGIEVNSSAITGNIINLNNNQFIGKLMYDNRNYFNGKIDEVQIFSRAINETEISNIYNYGSVEGPLNLTISATNIYTNTPIQNFTATLVNGTVYNTTTGEITTDIIINESSTQNISVTLESENYFDKVDTIYYNQSLETELVPYIEIYANNFYNNVSLDNYTVQWNGTNYTTTTGVINLPLYNDTYETTLYKDDFYTQIVNLTADPYLQNYTFYTYQSIVNYEAYDIVSGLQINNFTVDVNNQSTTVINPVLYLDVGTYIANISKSGYYTIQDTFTTTAVTEQTETVDLFNHKVNFTLTDLGGTGNPDNFTIDVYSDDYDYHEQFNTETGSVLANLSHGNYTVWVNDTNWAFTSTDVELSSSANYTDINLEAYTTNSITFNFVYEDTLQPIDNLTITMNLIGDIEGNIYNYTITNNDTFYVDLLAPDTYRIQYYADGYESRNYYLTLEAQKTYNITLYLSDDEQTTPVVFTVVDDTNINLDGVLIQAKKLIISEKAYKVIASCETAIAGSCFMELELGEVYSYVLTKGDETVIIDPFQLITTEQTFKFITTGTFNNLDQYEEVYGDLSYNDATNNFKFIGGTDTGNEYYFCLNLYNHSYGANEARISQSCINSASFTLYENLDVTGENIYATGTVTINDTLYLVDTLSQDNTIPLLPKTGKYGTFIAFIIIVVMFLIGISINYYSAIIMPMVGLLLTKFINLIPMDWGYVILVIVIGIIAAMVIEWKGRV